MLMYVQQDIFKSPAQVIVNTVNTVGVMGKGIAKRYKEVYPDMYKQYQNFVSSICWTSVNFGSINPIQNGY